MDDIDRKQPLYSSFSQQEQVDGLLLSLFPSRRTASNVEEGMFDTDGNSAIRPMAHIFSRIQSLAP